MESIPFYIEEWLPEHYEAAKCEPVINAKIPQNDIQTDIENVIADIENKHIDLTSNYDDWVQIGFALANELGERGRSYFHRISKFYPKYTVAETDKKYDNYLKSHNRGITIKTFFYLAKQAGIAITQEKKTPEVTEEKTQPNDELLAEEENLFHTPLLPDKIYQDLPVLLKETCALFHEGIEKDIFLLSAITVLSGCLPQMEGVYFNRHLSAHLYLFITGPSASGKGTMIWARYLAQTIHEEMYKKAALAREEYLKALEVYENLPKAQKAGILKPEEPTRTLLFIPANSSSAALTQLLAENNFSGIIFESEADTLSNTTRQDWGDSSDIFRKAFHHENTSMARKTNREMIEITNPHLAICLSGTPRQVHHLMPEVENGLFSRFMYYAFQDTRGFLNPFVSHQPIDYHEFFTSKSYEVYHLYDRLKKLPYLVNFKLTDQQALRFTGFFQTLLDKNKMLLSRDLDANTKRLGVITFRIAMVLSALRFMEMEIGMKIRNSLICNDTDFDTAMTIAATLESHAVAVYQQMPKVTMKGMRLKFYEKLPKQFDRRQYLAVAKEIGLNSKTAENYISLFNKKLLVHDYNQYTKVN
jgi:hypothetical protein